MNIRISISHKLNSLRKNRALTSKFAAAIAGTVWCLSSSTLYAQDKEPGLTLGAIATGSYSDNYLRLSDITALERPHLIREEYSLSTNAQLGWTQRLGRQYLSLAVDAGYRFNKNNSFLDTEFINSDAGLNWQLGSKCTGIISAAYKRRQGEFETVEDIVNNTLSSKSASSRNNCLFSSRLGISFGGDIFKSDNTHAARALNDLESQSVWGGLQLELGGKDYASIFARQSWRQYDNRLVTASLRDKNKQLDLGLEFQKSLGPRITLNGWSGYSDLKNEILPQMSFDGFSGKIDLSYKVGSRHEASFGARKEIDSASNVTASYIKVEGLNAKLSSTWGAKLHSELSVNQDKRDIAAVSLFGAGNITANLEDKTRSASASLAYDIGRTITLRLSGNYIDRNAAFDRFDYTVKSVFLSFQYRYK